MPIEIYNSGIDLSGDVEVTARTSTGIGVRKQKSQKIIGSAQSTRSRNDLLKKNYQKCPPYQPIGSLDSVFNLKVLKVARDGKGGRLNKKKQIKLKNRHQTMSKGRLKDTQILGAPPSRLPSTEGDMDKTRLTSAGTLRIEFAESNQKSKECADVELERHLGAMITHKNYEKVLARGVSGGYSMVRQRLEVGQGRLKSLRARGVLVEFTEHLDAMRTALWAVDDIRKKGHNPELLFDAPSLENYNLRSPRMAGAQGPSSNGQHYGREEDGIRFSGIGTGSKMRVYQSQLRQKIEDYERRKAEAAHKLDISNTSSYHSGFAPAPPLSMRRSSQFRGRRMVSQAASQQSLTQPKSPSSQSFEGPASKIDFISAPEPTRGKTSILREKGEKLEAVMARTRQRSLQQVSSLVGTLRGFTEQRRDLETALSSQLNTMDMEWSHAMKTKFEAFQIGNEHTSLEEDIRIMYRGCAEHRQNEIRERERAFAWHGRMMKNLKEYMNDQPFPPRMVEYLAAVRAIIFLAGDGTGQEMTRELHFELCKELLTPDDHKHRGIQRMLRLMRKPLDITIHQYMDWLKENEIEIPTQVIQWSQGKHKKQIMKRRLRNRNGFQLGAIGETEVAQNGSSQVTDGTPPNSKPKTTKRSSIKSIRSKVGKDKRGSMNSTASSRLSGTQSKLRKMGSNKSSLSSTSGLESEFEETDSYSNGDDDSVMESVFNS